MPELDALQQALQQLQHELTGFKSAKYLLDAAREKLGSDHRRWEQQQDADAHQRAASVEEVKQAVEEVKQARAAVMDLVNQCSPLAERMVAVAKAVDTAGFPHRLDSMQTNTANAMAAIQSVQSRLDLLEVNQGNALKLAVNELKAEMFQAKQELTARLVRLMVIWVVSGVLLVGIAGPIFWMLWGKM